MPLGLSSMQVGGFPESSVIGEQVIFTLRGKSSIYLIFLFILFFCLTKLSTFFIYLKSSMSGCSI